MLPDTSQAGSARPRAATADCRKNVATPCAPFVLDAMLEVVCFHNCDERKFCRMNALHTIMTFSARTKSFRMLTNSRNSAAIVVSSVLVVQRLGEWLLGGRNL